MKRSLRLRFGLRTLLLLTTVLAVWLGIHLQRTKAQREAVDAIQKYGGWVRYDYQFPSGAYADSDYKGKALPLVPAYLIQLLGIDFFCSVVQVNLNYSEDSGARLENHNQSDAALQHLPNLPNLRVLLLSDGQATDDSLRYVGKLKRLETLYMWDVAKVGDTGVAHLAYLSRLKYVHISTSRITDKSLEIFAGMPQMEGLSLQFNSFTDRGVKQLTKLPRLESLWVCGRNERVNAITNSALADLEELKGLKELGIQHTEISPEAVSQFQLAVPGCKVHR